MEILDFIKRRFSKDSNWTCGNCYYFAQILKMRFPQGEIYYNKIQNHFIFLYCGTYYDWSGIYYDYNQNDIILWEDMKRYDALEYSRIIRDCVM